MSPQKDETKKAHTQGRSTGPLRVLFASGAFFAFAGSANRYRQYFRRFPAYHIEPVIATNPPLKRKTLDEEVAPPPIRGLASWAKVDDTPALSIRTFGDGKVVRRFMLFLLTYWMLLSDRDIKVVHMLQQAKVITFPWALILRLFPVVRVLSITKDYPRNRWTHPDFIQRAQFNLYDAIICQSEDQREHLLDIGVKTETLIVPNGVDTEKFRPASEEERRELRERLGLPVGETVFLYVGSVQPRKGTDILLEAWTKLLGAGIKAKLYVLGPRFDLKNPRWADFTAALYRSMGGPGMKESVEFHGFQPNVGDYLRAADGFVFPSENEGVPNAVLEAMACGVPCVLTPFFRNSTMLGQPGRHFILTERTPDALSEGLLRVAGDPGEARRCFGREARQLMLDTMSMDHAVRVHCGLYRKYYDLRFSKGDETRSHG